MMKIFAEYQYDISPHKIVNDSKSEPLAMIDFALRQVPQGSILNICEFSADDLNHLCKLLENLTGRVDLHQHGLIKAANHAIENASTKAAFLFCEKIIAEVTLDGKRVMMQLN